MHVKLATAAAALLGATACAAGSPPLAPPRAAAAAPADPEVEAVLETIDAFFTAFAEGDVDTLERMLEQPSYIRSVRPFSDRGGFVRERTYRDWLESMRENTTALREVYWDPVVEVRDPLLATVWAPYRIEVDGALSHCGVDHFTLVKRADRWRIADLTYTTEPDACDELAPGPNSVVRPAEVAEVEG